MAGVFSIILGAFDTAGVVQLGFTFLGFTVFYCLTVLHCFDYVLLSYYFSANE